AQEAASSNGPRPTLSIDDETGARWFAASKHDGLKSSGFKVSSMLKHGAPFVVVEVPKETCVVLVDDGSKGKKSIRLKGGALAGGPATGSVAGCTAADAVVLVQRELAGDDAGKAAEDASDVVVVLSAPAARVGGLFGLREIAEHHGLTLGVATVGNA